MDVELLFFFVFVYTTTNCYEKQCTNSPLLSIVSRFRLICLVMFFFCFPPLLHVVYRHIYTAAEMRENLPGTFLWRSG